MALVKFLKGNESSLPSSKTAGQVYITQDTHNMYVDIDNSNRKKITDLFISYDGSDIPYPFPNNKFIYIGLSNELYYINNGTPQIVNENTDTIVNVVNNLTSTSTGSALSANMGKTLKDQFNLYGGKAYITTSGTLTAYTLADTTVTSANRVVGTRVFAKFHVANGDNATLSVNGLTGVQMRFQSGVALIANQIPLGTTISLVWDGTYWIIEDVYAIANGANYGNVRFPTTPSSTTIPQSVLPYNHVGNVVSPIDLNDYKSSGTWVFGTPPSDSLNFPLFYGVYSTWKSCTLEVVTTYSDYLRIQQTLRVDGVSDCWVRDGLSYSSGMESWYEWKKITTERGFNYRGYGICVGESVSIPNFTKRVGSYVKLVFPGGVSLQSRISINNEPHNLIQYNGTNVTTAMIPIGHTAELAFNGTVWLLLNPATGDSAYTMRGTTSTLMDTANKVVTGVTLTSVSVGAILFLTFTNGNTNEIPTISTNGANRTIKLTPNVAHPPMIPVGYVAKLMFLSNNTWEWLNADIDDDFSICPTDAATANKIVLMENSTVYLNKLITVYFPLGNTSISPVLVTKATGYYPIKYNNLNITANMIPPGHMAKLYFDGSAWQLLNPHPIDLLYVMGEYLGDGSFQREIILGFKPSAIQICPFISDPNMMLATDWVIRNYPNLNDKFVAGAFAPIVAGSLGNIFLGTMNICQPTNNGFYVYDSRSGGAGLNYSGTNVPNVFYTYIAWR